MTRATDLSEAINARLAAITPADGYSTAVAAVYGFGDVKPDKAPLPCVLVRISSDEMGRAIGSKVSRTATYEIEGVMSRSASLQDLQRLHHDIIKTLGADTLPGVRPLDSGWLFEESAEFDPEPGGTLRSVVSTVTIQYIES